MPHAFDDTSPNAVAYVPAAHCEQTPVARPVEYEPAMHGLHSEAPEVDA